MARYTAVNVYPQVRQSLHRFAALASGASGRRVTLSQALAVAVAVAEKHLDEVAAELAADQPSDDEES